MRTIRVQVIDESGAVVEELPRYSDAAKRRLCAAELVADPDQSNRLIAARLGVERGFVKAMRARLEDQGAIPRLEKTEGRDGIRRPLRQRQRHLKQRPADAGKHVK